MDNKLIIKTVINEQDVTFEIVVKGSNDYTINAKGFAENIIVRELLPKNPALIFFKSYKIAGAHVNALKITHEHLEQIKEIEKGLRQEAMDITEKRKQDLLDGTEKFHVPYTKGKALSGYLLYGLEAKLLREIGVASKVRGWKTRVDEKMIKKIGEDFTYAEALEYAKPMLERRKRKERRRNDKTADKMGEAKRTGKRVVIRKWQDDCDEPSKLCDIDNVIKYALPDGTTEIVRKHTGLMR